MTQQSKEECEKKLEKERAGNYRREVRDFIRTGDNLILRRVVFRNFIFSPVSPHFTNEKAQAVMMIMASDRTINMALNFER